MKILCVYATRQIDSNLFMASTVFNGLNKAGHNLDIIIIGHNDIIEIFEHKYAKFFKNIYKAIIRKGIIARHIKKDSLKVLYSFYLHFCKDAFFRPYNAGKICNVIEDFYDCILSFIPSPLNGLAAIDLHNQEKLKKIPLIQFWTDPLSLGRCNTIKDIPRSRFMHRYLERRILRHCDKAVFWYKYLYEMECQLYPQFASKMTYSHVSYLEHAQIENTNKNSRPTIGFFGSYQKRVRNIEPFLNAISKLPEYDFIIRGDSDLIIDSSKYPNLNIIYGRQPSEEVERLEAGCDILVSIAAHCGCVQPAGKTFYYANYNKPILHIGDGPNKQYFADYLKSIGDRWIICDNEEASIVENLKLAVNNLSTFVLNIPKCMDPVLISNSIIDLSNFSFEHI